MSLTSTVEKNSHLHTLTIGGQKRALYYLLKLNPPVSFCLFVSFEFFSYLCIF